FQHRDSRLGEDVGSQVVFEVQHTDGFGLIDQWQAENGARVTFTDVRIRGKGIVCCGIVDDHTLMGAHDIMDDRLWSYAHSRLSPAHDDSVAADRGFGLYPLLDTSQTNQQPSLSTRVLDRRAHQCVDQSFQNDLARDRLRDLDNGGQIPLFDGCHNRAGRTGSRLYLPE